MRTAPPINASSQDCDLVSTHNNIGVLLCHAGKLKDALAQFYEALRHVISEPSLVKCPRTRDICVSAARTIYLLLEGIHEARERMQLQTELDKNSGRQDIAAIMPTCEPYDRPRLDGKAAKTFRCMKICKEDEAVYSSLNIQEYNKRPSIIMLNMGIVLQKAGLNTQADEVYELATSFLHEQYQGILDRNDYLVQANIGRNVGQLRLEEGNLQDSLVLFSDAFEAAQSHLSLIANLDDAEVRKFTLERVKTECLNIMIASLSNIGMIHYSFGDSYMAELVAVETRDFLEDMPESHCDNFTTVLYNLALVHYTEGNCDSALKEFNALLVEVVALHRSSNHPLAAAALYRIGSIYFGQSRYNDSMRSIMSALSIREALYGCIHSDVANTLFMIGRILYDQKEYAFAIDVYHRIDSIQRTLGGCHDSQLAMPLYIIGRIHIRLGAQNAALTAFQKAVNVLQRNPGNEQFLVEVLVKIGSIYSDRRDAGGCLDVCSKLAQLDVPEEVLTTSYIRISTPNTILSQCNAVWCSAAPSA